MTELELDTEQLARNDNVYNAVYECICTLTEQELDWDIEMIEEATESIKEAIMSKWGLRVRQYEVETDEEGNQRILTGLEELSDETNEES